MIKVIHLETRSSWLWEKENLLPAWGLQPTVNLYIVFFYIFSRPDRVCGQLNRWHCHWLTDSLTHIQHSCDVFQYMCVLNYLQVFFLRISTLNLVSVYLTIQSFYMCRKFSPQCLWQISSLIKTMTTMPQLSTAIPSQPSPSP